MNRRDPRRLRDDRRGRLTIPDIMMALAATAFAGALWPVVYDGYKGTADLMSQGTEMLVLFLLPLTFLVLFFVIVRRAVAGVGR